ncbi:MAG TPA: 1,4-dihydroxy-2-naphthoate polyprenyltransferase [Acidobacteriota bacterium]|nr:1,4-dihydroxy-2-naphthoate polyprenyltransferase [Acidobacteriota bacterium]
MPVQPSRLNVWIRASRPKTLWLTVSPVIIGTAMAYADGGLHLPSALAALLGAVMIQIGTNLANDYFDYAKGTDRPDRLGPLRVTQAGLVSPSVMKRATALVFLLAVLAGAYLVYRGGWPIVAIGLISIACGLLYTAGPLPLGYTGLADLFVLVFFGPVAVGGTYYVQTLHLTWPVILAGLAPGLFSVAVLTVNNLRDIDSDRLSGKRTLAVRFGPTFARLEYVLAILFACLIPAVLASGRAVMPWPLLPLLVLPLALPSAKLVLVNATGPVLNNVLAATGRLLFVYAILFTIGWLL